jgi:T4 bacteriophage base plate protein
METSIANNPLARHFRQPSIFLKLPSGGRFYPAGTLELGVTGEVPIYPMTVKDELLLKTPDALMNGSSMSNMILSCCPSIKDPWSMPLIDLDPILIAIRLASYGEGMDMTSTCSHCGESNEHTIDLRQVLDRLKPMMNYDQQTFLDGLVFDIQPQTFKEINTASIIAFEQQKLVSTVENSDLTVEEKKAEFQTSFAKLTELNIGTLVSSIRSITTEDGIVVKETELIKDFLSNCDRKTYDSIRELIVKIVNANALDPMPVKCTSCEKEYTVTLDFNQSNFFV